MNSESDNSACVIAPMRIAIMAVVAICAAAAIPIYRCVDEYEDIFSWLASVFAIICCLLIFLILSLFFKETRRGLPPFRSLKALALIRLLFSSLIIGFVLAVIVDARARTAVFCVWFTAIVFILSIHVLATVAEKQTANFGRKSCRLFEFLYFQLALAVVLFELLCNFWPFRAQAFLLEKPNMDVESFIHQKRSYTFQFTAYRDLLNSSGYFDREFVKERPENGVREVRVALFADSFGAQYYMPEQLFPNLAEKLLNQQGEENTVWNVMNYSMSGFGPREYVYLIEKEARFYRPDLYVICYFAGNDLYDAYSRSEISRSLLSPSRWYFYTIPWKLQRIYRERKMIKEEDSEAPIDLLGQLKPEQPSEAVFSSQAYLERELRWAKLYQAENNADGEIKEKAYAEVERLFVNANEITHGRLVVVIIPTYLQVDPEYFKREMKRYEIIDDIGNPHESIERITQICRDNNIQCFDPVAEFRLAEEERRTYIVNDIHWNEYGQNVAGRFLAEILHNWKAGQR